MLVFVIICALALFVGWEIADNVYKAIQTYKDSHSNEQRNLRS